MTPTATEEVRDWNDGILEYWNGRLEYGKPLSISSVFAFFHCSSFPTFHSLVTRPFFTSGDRGNRVIRTNIISVLSVTSCSIEFLAPRPFFTEGNRGNRDLTKPLRYLRLLLFNSFFPRPACMGRSSPSESAGPSSDSPETWPSARTSRAPPSHESRRRIRRSSLRGAPAGCRTGR